jgi:hypothetical protein
VNFDLRQGLHDLSQSERPFLDELPVGQLQQRAHRQRIIRTTAYSAVGAGAAAAVAVGGVVAAGALLGPQPPAPPATAAPDPSTTADPAAPVTPAWAPDWQACGQVYFDDSFYNLDGDADWRMWTDQERIAQVDQPFTIEPRLGSSRREGQAVEVSLTDVTATRFDPATLTWEIVGVAAQEPISTTSGAIPADGTGLALAPTAMTVTSCDASPLSGGDGSAVPLSPELSYTHVGTAEVSFPDGRTLKVTSTLGPAGAEPQD